MKRIGILGFGTMGLGIAEFFISQGIDVCIWGHDKRKLEDAIDSFCASLGKKRGTACSHQLCYSTDISTLYGCDLIIEAVIEDMNVKKSVLKKLKKPGFKDAIVASNTSSLSITKLATSYHKQSNFIGMHFMNPADKIALVEVIPGKKTSKSVILRVMKFLEKAGKKPVLVKDVPGFAVNRLVIPIINRACLLVEQKAATVEDIDLIMKNLGFPMGPFELADLIGIDVVVAILRNIGEKPSKLLLHKIKKKHIGMKSKQGFYRK